VTKARPIDKSICPVKWHLPIVYASKIAKKIDIYLAGATPRRASPVTGARMSENVGTLCSAPSEKTR
jgi:hypothetical protein